MENNNIYFENKQIFTKDLITNKKRYWDPNRSKVCASIKKKIKMFPIKKNSLVLYLGCAEGYTVSYLSDIVKEGIVVGVDLSAHSMQRFYILAKERKNILPLLEDANQPDKYKHLIDFKVDVIVQDVSQKNQIEILKKNSDLFLKKGGYVMLSLKTTAISQKNIKEIIDKELKDFRQYFRVIDYVRLDPFEKKHLFIVGQK